MSFKLRDEHWETMLTFFEAHPDLSHGRLKGLNARERAKQLWAELTQKLNSLGFGERKVDKWQKVAEKENEKFRASDNNQNEDVLSLDESQPGTSNPASTPKTNKRIIDQNHDYGMGSAKKSKKKTNIEDAYIETVEVLKEIKNCLHAGLADIKDSPDGIRSAIEKNQTNT
ncbi:unnamed protein product [Callosobruchus maculatus]|uniref:Uncharacterized protein n=1 Tax=Callosobruchus maculatus TaxID=64391 RepID=A0A653DVK5_CALMS|nr:unnamed protein product [Callosobruchus maculatus]